MVIGVELFSVAMVVLSVYTMLKAGDELGEALDGNYSETEKAELFGKAAVMMILSAVSMYGAVKLVTQPDMLRSIVTESKAAIGKKFSEVKSLAGILRVKDADSLLSYCEGFVSSPAEAYLQEAVQGKNVRQLHELAKMVREARGKIGRMLTQDELAAAVSNWKKTGSIKKAVQAAYEWFQNISSQAVEPVFQKILEQILDRYEVTIEEFNHLRLKKVDNLNESETLLMKTIRQTVPKVKPDTYLQKVIPAEDIPKYLGEDGYSEIQGFIAKYDDVSHIRSYDDVVESFRLDYVSKGKRPFPEGGDTYGYIKFKSRDVDKISIPFGEKMGGTNTDAPPCTLNGFTGARNGEIIAEWFIHEDNKVIPIDGAELHMAVNGVDTIIALYENGHFMKLK